MQPILDRAEQLFCRTIEFASKRASNGRLLRRAVHPELYDLTPEDLAALEAAGIDLKLRVKVTHDDAVNSARQNVRAVALSDAANAFVVGLNPANIRWRAILRAYAITVQVPTHKLQLKNDESHCKVCGVPSKERVDPVSNAYFVAAMGTCGDCEELYCAAQTLKWFSIADPPIPTTDDWKRFQQLVDVIAQSPPKSTSHAVAQLCKSVLGGDKYSRSYVMDTLGFTGVLKVAVQRGNLQKWTNWSNRAFGGHKFQEMPPPACQWRRSDGFNEAVVCELFPKVKIPEALLSSNA